MATKPAVLDLFVQRSMRKQFRLVMLGLIALKYAPVNHKGSNHA